MPRKEPGQRFEDEVVVRLYREGAEMDRSEHLDLRLCVDFSLKRFPETQLPKPIDVQLTFQGGNADKLERFRDKTLKSGRDAMYLYVVVPTGMKADEAAHQIHLFAFVAARDGTLERTAMMGVFLNKRDAYQTFDIEARIAHLREREDPVRSADRRVAGFITALGENGAATLLSVENNRAYHMRLGDAAAPRLKAMLKTPEAFMDLLIGCKVTFIPNGRNALSVLLA